jgi:hypothetical protein
MNRVLNVVTYACGALAVVMGVTTLVAALLAQW